MKKAIFTDIDNTILPKGHTKLSLKTIQTFKKALDLGYEVFLISGRPIKYVEYLAKSIDDRVKAIGFNGNYSDRFIDNPIKKDILLDTFKNILADNSNFVYKSIDCVYSHKEKMDMFTYDYEQTGISYKEFVDINKSIENDIYKIVCLSKIKPQSLLDNIDSSLSINLYDNIGFEITSNLNKKDAIEIICNKLNIDLSNSLIFGDDINDCCMFELDAKKFVVKNCNKECLKYNVTLCDYDYNDGVAKQIEKELKI